MSEIVIRDYKDLPLAGGTLLVSVPQFGIASVLLTDHILETYRMDHAAAVDSDEFPPLAMVRKGKARYPVRIHADPASRLAVVRSEFPQPAYMLRPLARALLAWARDHGIEHVMVLDNITGAPEEAPPGGSRPSVFGIASDDKARERLRTAGVEELDDAVLGGILGMLVLEARFEGPDAIGLVAEVRSAIDEAESLLAFADALGRVVPGLRLDVRRLQKDSREVAETIRGLQAEIERTMRQMHAKPGAEGPPIYG